MAAGPVVPRPHRPWQRRRPRVLVNTSFKIRGEPIVCTPADAFRCFMATQMDALVLEDFLLLEDKQPEEIGLDAETYLAQFELD